MAFSMLSFCQYSRDIWQSVNACLIFNSDIFFELICLLWLLGFVVSLFSFKFLAGSKLNILFVLWMLSNFTACRYPVRFEYDRFFLSEPEQFITIIINKAKKNRI